LTSIFSNLQNLALSAFMIISIPPSQLSNCHKRNSAARVSLLIFGFLIIFGLFINLFVHTSKSHADDEIRGWVDTEWKFAKLSEDSWLDFRQEERWGENIGDHNYSDSRIRVNMKVLPWMNISLAESYIKSERAEKSDRIESRHTLELRPFWKGEVINFDIRQRLEMKEIFGDSENTGWSARTRFQISGSKDYFGVVQPIIDNEFFYNLSDREYDQNRFFAGVSFNIFKDVQLRPMYGFQSQKRDGDWDTPQVFRLSIVLDLPII
jgi:hypothetical protein